jgi:hypothetical protein
MKPNAKKRSANKSGAVLVTAVVVLLIMSILMTATIGHVAVNRRKTNSNYSHKQAYLTASTTLKSFVAEIRDITSAPTDASDTAAVAKQIANINALKQIAQLTDGTNRVKVTYNGTKEDGTGYKLGTTELEIKPEGEGTDKLIITAYTTYGGETEKVAAHISTETAKKPAKFTNTLEEIGKNAMTLDNLRIVGDTAVLDNDNLSKTYTLNNDCDLMGSLYVWGNVKTTSTNSIFRLRPNMQHSSMGSFVMISQDFTGRLTANSSMKLNDGFNFVYVGGTLKSTNVTVGCSGRTDGDDFSTKHENGHQVDIITHEFDTTIDQSLCGGDNFNVYGNVYCYSEDPPVEGQKGDFLIGKNTDALIQGDCYVEGDLDLSKCEKGIGLRVTGDLHVKGTIKGSKSKIKAKNIYEGKDAVIDKTGRGADPKERMEYSSDAYEYMPEDMFMNIDGASSDNFKTKYLNFYKGTPLNMFKDFNTTIDTTDAAFNYYVDKDCVIDNLVNYSAHDKNTVLVDVKDKDVMIMLKAGTSIADGSGPEIVVRNLSPIEKHTDQDTGRETEQHKYNCYFVSDSGNKIVANGKDEKGIHLHTGSNAHLTNPDNAYFEFGNMWVYDYETFIRMFKESFRKNKDRGPKDAAGALVPNFYYNPTANKDLNGTKDGKVIYGPGISNIIFIIGEDFHFGMIPVKAGTGLNGEFTKHEVDNNGGFFQMSLYAPQTTFGLATSSGLPVKTIYSDGVPHDDLSGKNILGAGVFISGMFNTKNNSYFLYTEPASTSVLSNAKGNKGGEIAGFNLDRYDHY